MKTQMDQLVQIIQHHNYRYYVLNDPEISDQQYNAIFEKLRQLETDYPEYALPNSPTVRVGSDLQNQFKSFNHALPMLSMQSYYSVPDFVAQVNATQIPQVILECKYDGLAIELVYKNGSLYRATTRGNGHKGNDVTDNIRTIQNIPLAIDENTNCVIRGEVLITEDELVRLNKYRRKQNLQKLPNTRNAAAIYTKASSSAMAAIAHLQFVAYFSNIAPDHIDSLFKLQNWGFTIVDFKPVNTANLETEVTQMLKIKQPYPTDGIVAKAPNINWQKRLGHTSRIFKWVWAVKPVSDILNANFIYVEYKLSKEGYITPVIHFYPVKHKGIQYSSVKIAWDLLHSLNLKQFSILQIRIKGNVAAEVIDAKPQGGFDVIPATKCPCCKHPLTINGNTHRCNNPQCPEQTGINPPETGYQTYLPNNFANCDVHTVRAAAIDTPALVLRTKRGSHKALIYFKSKNTIFTIFQRIGSTL